MNIVAIGDVHGCFYTFQAIVEKYWKDKDILVQVGDLIDRGNFSGKTVEYARDLQISYPERVFFLLGNHEYELIKYTTTDSSNWLRRSGRKTLNSFNEINLSLFETAEWLKKLPLFWKNEDVFLSHAGISKHNKDLFDLDRNDSIIWNRENIKNIDKIQVVGHTPITNKLPLFDIKSNTWYIDTGACFEGYLSGIKLNLKGEIIDIFSIKTILKDI